MIKRIGKFFCSMKCAILLLMILIAACTLGSLIPQRQVLSYYTENYSGQTGRLILALGLDDVFHCAWFLMLTLCLCLNLLFCSVLHFPKLLHRMKYGFSLEQCRKRSDISPAGSVRDPETLFLRLGLRSAGRTQDDGQVWLYASRRKAGIWGAWLCHLGMLVIIAGFGLGQMLQSEYTVYGVPGQTKAIGELPYELTIDRFEILLREDDTVRQYQADITVTDTESKKSSSAQTSVNHPASMFGMKFYQNSTGWAAMVTVLKKDETLQEELLCAGEYLETKDKDGLYLMLRAFYPDYAQDELGSPYTASSALKNPAYLYALYYHDQMLGMNVIRENEKITVDDYTYIFHDPQPYTLIQVKRDPFMWLAAIGGLLVILALILAFYVRPEEVWAAGQPDGTFTVYGYSQKGGSMFQERIAEACKNTTKETPS